MPLYEYKCSDCGFRFEELINQKDNSEVISCKKCGSEAKKIVSRFSSVIAGGSSNETVDMTIGREANKRWTSYHERQSKRRDPKKLQSVDLPKTKEGSYQPVMALGGKEDRAQRKDYVGALQDHRKKRIEKGIPQFSGPGVF